jgi:AcrR family transcriptional regulator
MARPRGNYAVTAARREAIIQAALEIFGKSGYSGSSLKQVAEAVGMTEAGILHHFGTKGNLLIEVLQTRDDKAAEFIPLEGAQPVEFVIGWLELVEYNVSQPGIIELYAKLSAEATAVSHPAHGHFMNRYKFVSDFNKRYFDILANAGLLNTNRNSKALSTALIAISDGLQIQWLLDPTISIRQALSEFFESILTTEAWSAVLDSLAKKQSDALDAELLQLS